MKQSEKLDLILKFFYERRYNGLIEYNYNILNKIIPISNDQELYLLIKRLQSDGYLKTFMFEGNGGGLVEITSYGIEYCEEDSYSYSGYSIITNNYNTTITDSSGVSVVNSSTNVNVTISNIGEINNKFHELIEKVKSSNEVSKVEKAEILECITEIQESLSLDKKPKFAFKSLLEMTNNFAGIGSLALEISKILFK